ncbi:hypothetical protein B0H34DRAFT_847237 [Crassisporium funariophilum]|nr:hypothetical protein B0H34DRAFT_847237 [Crassisporium funariophilum]
MGADPVTELLISTPEIIKAEKSSKPPSYECCTPISRNIMVGDDSHYLPFIPNADDPTYDSTFDIDEHDYFAWQQPDTVEPDFEVVIVETARRLLDDHLLSRHEIDKTEVLPIHVQSIMSCKRKRDFPKWEKVITTLPLSRPSSPVDDGPKDIVDHFVSRFCNNLNCLISYCTTHLVDTHLPNVVPPKIPYAKLVDVANEFCGQECFLQAPPISNYFASTNIISRKRAYSPDMSSCDLAVICRKPCREVHKQREQYLPPPTHVEKGRHSHALPPKTYGSVAVSINTNKRPCKHDGPCNARSNCPCFANKAHCRNTCRCSKTCPRKWKGCTCARSEKACGTNKCSCFKAYVECDPEVCLSCEAKSVFAPYNFTSGLCNNAGIQRGSFKATKVRQSQWGLGLYMSEPCKKGELIAEYVGELIFEPTIRSRDGVVVHKGRSYVFELNPTYSLDSDMVGNETRYINHSENSNCTTSIKLVNGEHRIGIFAGKNIESDEELFINYGPKFFVKDKAPDAIQDSQQDGPIIPAGSYDHPSDSTDLTYENDS